MLTEHKLSVTLALNQLLPPRLSQSGQVQGRVLLLLHCFFPTIGALCFHSFSSSEASPNRFRLRVPTVHWYHLRALLLALHCPRKWAF